jgi:hypothetical protein
MEVTRIICSLGKPSFPPPKKKKKQKKKERKKEKEEEEEKRKKNFGGSLRKGRKKHKNIRIDEEGISRGTN